ncbi:MAG: MlaA family lipoprotein [Methylococcales bacterium]
MNSCVGGFGLREPFRFVQAILVLTLTVALGGCAATRGKGVDVQGSPDDPYESLNREVFQFNHQVDTYVAKPISDGYKWVAPEFMQTGIANFFDNLSNVDVVLNDLLQAKFQQSAEDMGRLVINTTAGIGGLLDVAKQAGLEQNDEDFEQTLAVWGVPRGSYLVIPFLGPSTARGIPGTIVDTAANPTTYAGWPFVQIAEMVNARANAEGALKFIDETALDPYVFTRESFLQWRNHLATDGKDTNGQDLGDLEDALFDENIKSPNAAEPHAEPGAHGKTTQVKKTPQDAENQSVPQSMQNSQTSGQGFHGRPVKKP